MHVHCTVHRHCTRYPAFTEARGNYVTSYFLRVHFVRCRADLLTCRKISNTVTSCITGPPDSELNDTIPLCFRKDSQHTKHRTECGDHGFQANILEEPDLDFTSMGPLVSAWHGFAVWYLIVQFCVVFFIVIYICAMVYTKHELTLPRFYFR